MLRFYIKSDFWFGVGLVLLIWGFSGILSVKAMMFPIDARSVHSESLVNGSFNVLATTTERTILYVALESDGSSSQVGLYCADKGAQIDGTNDIYETHASPAKNEAWGYLKCYGTPVSTKYTNLGTKGGHVFLTYVDYDVDTIANGVYATTTQSLGMTNDTQQGMLLFFGVFVFYVGMWFVVWFFKKR